MSDEPYKTLLVDREAYDTLRSQNQALQERAEKAERWLRFIADTQHRLLDAFKLELSDEEWRAFAEGLGIEPDALLSPTQETDPPRDKVFDQARVLAGLPPKPPQETDPDAVNGG
jgi:hypothetical protein